MSYQTLITFIINSEKRISENEKDALNEHATETIANCLDECVVEAVSAVKLEEVK